MVNQICKRKFHGLVLGKNDIIKIKEIRAVAMWTYFLVPEDSVPAKKHKTFVPRTSLHPASVPTL